MLKNKQQHPINTQKDIFLYTSCQLNMGHLFSSLLNNNNKNQNLQLTQANGIILGLCISNWNEDTKNVQCSKNQQNTHTSF